MIHTHHRSQSAEMTQHKLSLAASAEKAYEACLVAAPRAGFTTLTSNNEDKTLSLFDDIIHGIELTVAFESTKLDACVALISVTGSMAILGQPRRMALAWEIKRYLRNQ